MEEFITIKEAASIVNLPTHTVRYYEQEGLLHPIKRDGNGNRLFTADDIEWLKFICCLRETGMSISEMKKFVAFYSSGDPSMEKRMKILCDHKEALLKKIKEMNSLLDKINNKIQWYDMQRKKYLNK
ncbi:MerR family transcriptional regulator [Clostridium sp. SYSU_GA19001]|uniref:MerR family transcriptional regulator n=1 Tax=Clostridium caldaquaticum TaxID=2940653 RepID=UPI0020778050|nr:MerR family transcriptional regulator [Clostridium caldaquaticum]MCM8709805.1 MerR family transcriptional regulator [Clostridium caldaquaticum]